MARIYPLIVFLFFVAAGEIRSQSRAALEEEAYENIDRKDYVKAYIAFDQLHARYPAETVYQFNLGVCCLYYGEKRARAIEIFKAMREKNKTPEVEAHLGLAYHKNNKFDEALATLRPALESLESRKSKEDKKLIEDVKMKIMNCENAKVLIRNKVIADVQNVGAPINSAALEGAPIITADESMMIFTYIGEKSLGGRMNTSMSPDKNGEFTADIFMSLKDPATGNWLSPEPIKALNDKGHNAALAMSPDGTTLFTFLSSFKNEGDIQVATLTGNEFSKPVSLNSNINNPDYWEGSCSISADNKHLYFSSERPEGFGGRDLYVSEYVNGDWGPAVNLGPKINTEYNDDAPFIHPDGITLFFSSMGHTSIGGYDIMFAIKEGNEWSVPKSMGMPLNTVDDDSYYVINSKGDKGYFSSTRDTKGALGEQDIYMVTPGILGEKPVVALLKGVVYGNSAPIEAKLDVVKVSNQEHIGPYHTNKVTGKYLTALSPGQQYRITITADGFTTLIEDFNIQNLTSYLEITKDFTLNAGPAEPAQTGVIAVNSLAAATTQQATTPVPPTAPEVKTATPEVPEAVVVKNEVKETLKEEAEPELVDSGKKEAEPLAKEIKAENTAAEKKAEEVAATKQREADNKTAALQAKKEKEEAALAKKAEEIAVAKQKEADKKTAALQTKKEKEEAALAKKAEENYNKEEARQEKIAKQGVAKQPEVTEKPEGIEVVKPCEETLPDLQELKGNSLNEKEKYARMLTILGEYCADGLVYSVQIGAYKRPDNYKYKNLQELGQVTAAKYPDGITRFTQKEFNTLKQAEVQRQRAISKGQKDAWIVAFVKGKRYTLEDLIMLDMLGKPVN